MTYEEAECEKGQMSSGNLNSLSYRQRWAEGPCGLGLQTSQCRDNLTSRSAFRTDLGYRSLESPIHSFVSTNPVDYQGECRFKLMRNFGEGVNRGDHMPPFPADQCEILRGSQIALIARGEEHFKYTLDSPGIPFPSSKCVLKDSGRENMFTSRMKEPLTSSQSRTNLSMQEFSLHSIMDEPRKRKYTDSSGLLVDNCTMTLNDCCSDYDGRWRETRRLPEVEYKNANLESTDHYQGRSFEGKSAHLFSGDDNMHRQLSEPWVSARSKGIMNGTLSDRVTDNGWRDRKIVDKIESKYLDPDFPSYSKTRRLYGDNSQEVFASRLLTVGESELLDIRHPDTCRSRFRTTVDRCGGSLGCTANSYLTRFHEREMDDNQWRVDYKYNNFSNLEQFCKTTNFTNDSLRKVTDNNSEYLHEYPSEIWVARTSGGLSKRPGAGSDYTSSIWGEEMKDTSWREKRRFSSTYETYPDAEPLRTLQIKHRHDSSLHRVATAGPPTDHLTDCMPGHQSERSVSSNREHSPPNRRNVHYARDSVEKFEKEKDRQDNNGWSNLQKPCNGQFRNQSVLLSYDESNQQSELNENSEEFKQRVHIAHLRFSKMLNEDSNQKKQLQGQSESGSLVCIVCGRNSKEFVDAHSLAMHAYDSQKTKLLAEHKGLYKALCVFLGWNLNMPPDNARSYQSLSLAETRANKENLILWPPLVIVQNTRVGQDKDGMWEGIGNPEMDKLLKELGFGNGKSKALYGKEGHKGIVLVKFSSSFSGLQEAEQLHKYFQGYCRGRKDWLRLHSSCTGKSVDDGNPDLVRVDKDTDKKRRVLYGYIGIAEDLEILDFGTRRKVSVKSREDMGKDM